VTAAEKLRA
jgi:predicted transposase YdaD